MNSVHEDCVHIKNQLYNYIVCKNYHQTASKYKVCSALLRSHPQSFKLTVFGLYVFLLLFGLRFVEMQSKPGQIQQ